MLRIEAPGGASEPQSWLVLTRFSACIHKFQYVRTHMRITRLSNFMMQCAMVDMNMACARPTRPREQRCQQKRAMAAARGINFTSEVG